MRKFYKYVGISFLFLALLQMLSIYTTYTSAKELDALYSGVSEGIVHSTNRARINGLTHYSGIIEFEIEGQELSYTEKGVHGRLKENQTIIMRYKPDDATSYIPQYRLPDVSECYRLLPDVACSLLFAFAAFGINKIINTKSYD